MAPRSTPGAREQGGWIPAGAVRLRFPSTAAPAQPPLRPEREPLVMDEDERRDHVRRWARMMIVHLERADFDAPQEGYVATLERLRTLLQREIDAVRQSQGPG